MTSTGLGTEVVALVNKLQVRIKSEGTSGRLAQNRFRRLVGRVQRSRHKRIDHRPSTNMCAW